jgi:murein DD-endopeptidase MepM/ murein hydrolase activator NlpD
MEKKFGQKVINKTIPLSLLGLLFFSKSAVAAVNSQLSTDPFKNTGKKAIENNNLLSISEPTLISSQINKIALLTSFSENLSHNQATFSNLLTKNLTTKTEFSIANHIKLHQEGVEAEKMTLIALDPLWQNNDSLAIPIPVSPPQNNQNTTENPVLTSSSVDPTNYTPEAQNQPVVIKPTEQASNLDQTPGIPIPVVSPLNNTQSNTKSYNLKSSSFPNEIRQNFNHKSHQVKAGETLSSISRAYGVSKKQLMRVNNLDNPNLIKINQTLTIPITTANLPLKPTLISSSQKENINPNFAAQQQNKTIVKENFKSDPYNYSPSQPQVVSAIPIDVEYYNPMNQPSQEKMVSPDLPPLYPPDQYLPDSNSTFNGYIWPAKGVLTSGYGWRWGRMHKGIDIAAPIGTPIVAASDGEVISAGWNSGGYGNLVKLKHFDGSITLYAHNSKIMVRRGQKVAQGQQIAAMGSTGYSTGPHLHFEIHPRAGKPANPIAFLPRK